MRKVSKVNVKNQIEKISFYLDRARKNAERLGNHVHISMSNSKMGKIPSFSVLPLVTCANCGQCSKYCYACKGCFLFPDNRMNLADNTVSAIENPEFTKQVILDFLHGKTVTYKYFRFNVAGDVFNHEYLEMIVSIARKTRGTKFLVFTKNYKMFNSFFTENKKPSNLSIIFSSWGGVNFENPHNFPIAAVDVPGEVFPDNVVDCSGNCQECLYCFNAKKGDCVRFQLH